MNIDSQQRPRVRTGYVRLLALLALGIVACSSTTTTNNGAGATGDGGGAGASSGGDCANRCVSYQAKCGNANAQADCQKPPVSGKLSPPPPPRSGVRTPHSQGA